MSDFSQGPGWWQASDGKWYPPEAAPAAAAPAPAPTGPPAYAAPTGPPPGGPPAYGTPMGSPAYGAPAGAPGQLIEWGPRVLAVLADSAILVVAYIALIILVGISGAIADVLGFIVLLAGWLAIIAYNFYILFLTGETGQSPGKRLLGIQVVSEATGQPIGGVNGIVRGFAHIADQIACGIGYLFPLWDPKKQTFADKIMKTLVIPGPKKSLNAELFKK